MDGVGVLADQAPLHRLIIKMSETTSMRVVYVRDIVCLLVMQGFDAPRRPSQGGDIEAPPPPPPPPVADEKDKQMEEFFREVSAIKVNALQSGVVILQSYSFKRQWQSRSCIHHFMSMYSFQRYSTRNINCTMWQAERLRKDDGPWLILHWWT